MRKCIVVGCERKHKAKGYCQKHYVRSKRGIYNAGMLKLYRKKRLELMKLLGGAKCKCGYSNVLALTFDHKNNDGKKDRSNLGSGYKFIYYYLKRPELAKKKLQVLCHNCNHLKRLE